LAYLRFITRHPVPIVLGAAVIAFAAFSSLVRLRIDNSMETWLIKDDPALAAYDLYREEFENDQFVVVGYEVTGGVLSDNGLAVASRLTEAFEQIDNVLKVTSLTNMEEMRAEGDRLTVGNLVTPPLSDSERARVLDKLRTDALYRRTLTSDDGRVGAIVIKIARSDSIEGHGIRAAILNDIRQVLAREQGTFHITGRATFDVELFDAFVRDQQRLIPIMVLVIVLVLGALFRNVMGVTLPMVTVSMSVLWTFAVIAVVGTPLSLVSGTLPVVLLAIGIADSVHLISEYQEELATGKKKLDALLDAIRAVFLPCLFTSVTTALGFLGMLVIHVRPIRDFGMYASIGTMLAFVATFTFVPAVLAWMPAPRVRNAVGDTASDRLTARVFRVVSAHRGLVLGVSLAGLVIGMAGLGRVQVTANTYRFLPPTNPAIQATDFIEAAIGGVNTMEVLVSARDTESTEPLKNVQALRETQTLQRKLAAFRQVEATLSPVDFISAMNRSFHEDKPEYARIPESRELVGQLMLMYELDAPDGEFYDYVNFDMTKARMTVRTSISGDYEYADLIAAVREASQGFDSIEAVPTGSVVLFSDVQSYMLLGMMRGFAVAFFCVALMMILLLRNLGHGLLAMIPGVLPIVFVVGMTGWVGMKVGVNSAMLGNIALGVAVDNAIHMLTRYRRLRREGVVAHEAIERASTVVGRPVLFTSVVLCAGFLVLCLSSTLPNQKFGFLTALVLAGSLLGSVGTLPATILLMEEYFGKDSKRSLQRAARKTAGTSVEHTEAA